MSFNSYAGGISLSVTTTNVSACFYPGYTSNLIGTNVFYNGTVSIIASGGTPSYKYTLTTPSGFSLIFNNGYFTQLPVGGYQIKVTDATGQVATASTTVGSDYSIPHLHFSNLKPPSSCNSADGRFTLSVTDGTPPYLYSIDGGVTFQTDSNFTGLVKGYYAACMVKDVNGLLDVISTDQFFAFTPGPNYFGCANCCPYISGAYAAGQSACANDSLGSIDVGVDYQDTRVKYPVTFSLDGIHYFNTTNAYRTGYYFYNLVPGLYKTYTKDSTGNISVFATPIVSFCMAKITYVSIDASCGQSDGGIALTVKNGTPPYTYTMDGINFQSDSTFTGLAAGTYSVAVKDANNFINSTTATVYNKCPKVSANWIDDSCNQHVGILQAIGTKGTKPYLFSINNGNTYQADSNFTGIAAGTYKIIMRDALGFTDTTIATVGNNCLILTVTTSDENCGNKNGSITVTGSGGTYPYYYSIDGINFQSNNIFSNLDSGTYTVTVRDLFYLIRTAKTTIKNNPPPALNLGNDTTLCTGQTLLLNPNVTGASYTWQDNSTNNTYQVTKAGKYWVQANANGCLVSDTISVSYLNLSNQIFPTHDTTLCVGSSITLTAQNPGATYLWNDSATTQTQIINSSGKYWVQVNVSGCSISDTINLHFITGPPITLPTDTSFCTGNSITLTAGTNAATYLWNNNSTNNNLIISNEGKYWVAATQYGCTSYDTVQIIQKNNPKIFLGNDTTLCEGDVLLLNATNSNATYQWQDGTTQPTYNITGQGTYTVKVTAANGCDTTGKIVVDYITKPIINLGNDTTLCLSDKLILNATYPNSTYLWQDNSTQSTYAVSQAGTYNVDVANICGNTIDSINVQYQNCACKFYIPSSFTPNGDGVNDTFKPGYHCFFTSYKMQIFNRFGQTIFSTENPGDGWDGKLNGLLQPTGTYIWELTYYDTLLKQNVTKTGTVVLVR